MGSSNSQGECINSQNSQTNQSKIRPMHMIQQVSQITNQAVQQSSNQAFQPIFNPKIPQKHNQALHQTVNENFHPLSNKVQELGKTANVNLIIDNQKSKCHTNSTQNQLLSSQKQSRQEIYQNRPRVQTIQSCTGCSSNILNTSNIEQNKNCTKQAHFHSKNKCNTTSNFFPCNTILKNKLNCNQHNNSKIHCESLNNCISYNKNSYSVCSCYMNNNNSNKVMCICNSNCNSCDKESHIFSCNAFHIKEKLDCDQQINSNTSFNSSKVTCICNSNCNSNHQNESCCFSPDNQIRNINQTTNKYSNHLDTECLCNKTENLEKQIQLCKIEQCDVCTCNNCAQNYEPKYNEYFNKTQEENNVQTQTLVYEDNLPNEYYNNFNQNETTTFYPISNTPLCGSNPSNYLTNQQFTTPLDQSLVYLSPQITTNLGTNQYLKLDESSQAFPILKSDPVIRNLVDFPDQITRNNFLKESKNKVRKTKSHTTNPITRETIQKLYDISEYEIKNLKKLFDTYSGVDKRLNFQEYVRLCGYMNQNLRGPKVIQLAEYAFAQGDTNNDGLINFDQFLITYALTKPYSGTLENIKEINYKKIQDYSNISLHSKSENPLSRRLINEKPLDFEYNQDKNTTSSNFAMTKSFHPEQHNYLSTVINSRSDKNLHVKHY